jgi:hypothetical protein
LIRTGFGLWALGKGGKAERRKGGKAEKFKNQHPKFKEDSNFKPQNRP